MSLNSCANKKQNILCINSKCTFINNKRKINNNTNVVNMYKRFEQTISEHIDHNLLGL